MRLMHLPAMTGLIPAIAIHVCYLIAANAGHVPWCLPYIDNCTSISAVGREGTERFIFRATMIPTAVLMTLYWLLNHQWLRSLESPWRRANHAMLLSGMTGCFGLLLYTTVLGVIGEEYATYRRIGVTIFYVFSVSAQIVLTLQLGALRRWGAVEISRGLWRALWILCVAVVAAGTLNLLLPVLPFRDLHNALAWTATFLILLHILAVGRAWKATGFRVAFTVGEARG